MYTLAMKTPGFEHRETPPPTEPAQPENGGWQGRAVGLLDLDAFFASVEQLDHPEWRGLPVIVGGDADKRGVVSTASYEARAFGVRSAMASAVARRLCPQAIWVTGRFDRYREMSQRVMACIERETPYVEAVSIDEAFFDITPGRFSHDSPVDICRRISAAVAELGITCSMGLSTCKTVSKIASERNKPNGITVVFPGTESDFLSPLSVRTLSGVGPQTHKVLDELGIHTLGQLASANVRELEGRLGIMARTLIARASGHEDAPVARRSDPVERKSVSSERTFAEDLTTREDIDVALGYIAVQTARRLREKGLRGRTVTVKCAYRYGETRSARTTIAQRTDDELEIARIARELVDDLWSPGISVRLLGIGLSNWEERPEQLSLFDDVAADEERREARRRLTNTADRLRERFGESAVRYGSEIIFQERVSKTAPTQQRGD